MKTTKKHFDIFKKECERWIDFFGLYGHRFYFQHENSKGISVDTVAYCIYPEEHRDRIFTLGLMEETTADISVNEIKLFAFHEVMEAFLYRIENFAKCRYIQEEEIGDEIHNIIMILEKVFLKIGLIKL